jgi:hypothetical protein
MAIKHVDLYNGNDANDGSTWALAKKTVSFLAAQLTPGDTIKISKTPDPVSIGNATWTDDQNYIVLDNVLDVFNITKDIVWTKEPTGDVTITQEAGKVSMLSRNRFTFDSAVQLNKKQAYYPTGLIDLSSFQELSFILYTNANRIVNNSIILTLCSDAVGNVPVDYFNIPDTWSYGAFCFNLQRVGGGNLANNIQSIALYTSGLNTNLASKYLTLDWIYATKTNGINLNTVFTKNPLATGGDEGYYLPSAIDGNIVYIDGKLDTFFSVSTVYHRYVGVTENVETYIRKTFCVLPIASSASFIITVKAGTAAAPINYEFGYNTTTNEIDGETLINLTSTLSYAFRVSHTFIIINNISIFRCNMGIYSTSDNFTLSNVQTIGGCSGGIYASGTNITLGTINNLLFSNTNITFSGVRNLEITEIKLALGHTNNNILFGSTSLSEKIRVGSIGKIVYGSNIVLGFQNVINVRIGFIGSIYNSYGNASGIFLNNVFDLRIDKLDYCNGHSNRSLNIANFGKNIEIHNITELGDIRCTYADIDLINVISVGGIDSGNNESDNKINVIYANGASKSIASGGVYMIFQNAVKHLETDIGSWEISPYSTYFNQYKIGKVAYNANALVTIKLWVKYSDLVHHLELGILARVIDGIMADSFIQADFSTTDWQEVTFTFTPTNAGVTDIVLNIYSNGSSSNNKIYFGPISTISQA